MYVRGSLHCKDRNRNRFLLLPFSLIIAAVCKHSAICS